MDNDSDGSADNEHSESSDDEEVEEDSDVSGDSYEDEDYEYTPEEWFLRALRRVKNNDSKGIRLEGSGHNSFIQDITSEKWEEIGRDISNCTYYLKDIKLFEGALNDEKMSYLFRGLTSSSSIKKLLLRDNALSVAAPVRSMVPFLQHADNLRWLNLGQNNFQSEGFEILCRALRDSPIERLSCFDCGIESIEIDTDYFPKKLKELDLSDNSINYDGCREVAKLLQGGDSTLKCLDLDYNNIDDEGVAILVDDLRNNTSLEILRLGNNVITKRGGVMLLKLVNDISSVKATLESNHTLQDIDAESDHEKYSVNPDLEEVEEVQVHINAATNINEEYLAEATGQEKIIQTQLHSVNRVKMAELQGVSHSVYSEINPLHLPEVLSLIGRSHGQRELYVALKSSIAEVISTVNRRQCIKHQMACLTAQLEELRDELAEIDAAEGSVACSNKRRRKQ